MNFETFFAAIMARCESRGGMDMTDPNVVLGLPVATLKSMLRETFELACRDGEPDPNWEPPTPS